MPHRIILIRHGKPTVPLKRWVSGHGFATLIEQYQAAGIAPDSVPNSATQSLVQSAPVLFSSDLRRAIHSAEILAPEAAVMSDRRFREAEFWCHFPTRLRLPTALWLILGRMLWSLGYAPNGQTHTNEKARAIQATEFLEAQVKQHNTVVLVAHGIINLMMSRALRKRGWQGPRNPNIGHWGCTIYQR